ncbi:hypothetical protein [Streptomyces hyaluromycini]|uniref:hypothetical protein n=1 Tax=Streptomyces hyaluromycini TaxID=1377993 RepID=UPI00142E5DF0|nr:hypothetical protein [Streptomyces hyaluromycini]
MAAPGRLVSLTGGNRNGDSTARGLGVAGLVVGVLGPAAAAFAGLRGRSTGSQAE